MKKILLICFFAIPISIIAQSGKNNQSVFYKAGAGIVIIENTGYSFTNELSLPFIKGVEIAPSITFASTLPGEYSYAMYNNYTQQDYISIGKPDFPLNDVSCSFAYMLSSFDLNVYIKPLDFIKTAQNKNHIIKIGGGMGFKHYTQLGMETVGLREKLMVMWQKINNSVGPNMGIQYNYIIHDKWLIGADFMICTFDGGNPSTSLRLIMGIKL